MDILVSNDDRFRAAYAPWRLTKRPGKLEKVGLGYDYTIFLRKEWARLRGMIPPDVEPTRSP